MRILKLHLSAFGPFTDASLDLANGKEGLHLIYGPNEAGKSSSLRAITDLFYGIHARTPDDFVHPYKRLRIGAQIQHSDGTLLEMVRRKANQKSLRRGDDVTPLDESELSRFLGDVDRDLFQVMFGIDHDRLRRGGEEIVQGGGKIGELLFAAGAGLADLQKVQNQLQIESDALLKGSGRSGTIATAIKEFQENRGLVKDSQVSVDTWKEHDERLENAQKQKRERDETIRNKRSEQNRLTRIRDAIPSIGHWMKASDELATVHDAPLLAEDFADQCNGVLIELKKAEQQRDDAEASIAKLNKQLKTVNVPESLVQQSDNIESLRDRLGGYRKAMSDRPRLDTSRELAESEAKEILRKLGRAADLTAVEELRLPADKTIRIQNLGNQQEGLVERLQSARRDRERIRREITRVEKKLQAIHVPSGAASVRSTVREIQKAGDLESQVENVRHEVEHLKQRASVALSQLPLWSGSVEGAEKLAVPSLTTVETFDQEMKETKERLKSQRDRRQEETQAIESLGTRLKQLELEQKVPTVDQLDSMRRLRQRGWQLVLEASRGERSDPARLAAFMRDADASTKLEDAYQSCVEEADRIADLLRTDADRVATKVKLEADQEQRVNRKTSIEEKTVRLEAELQQTELSWTALWEPLGIRPLSPLEMRDWLRQQHDISKLAEALREKQLEANQLQDRIDSLTTELSTAFKTVEPQYAAGDTSLKELLLGVSSRCDEFQKAESLRDQLIADLESERDDLLDAESRLAEAEEGLAEWQSDWAAEMLRLGLEDDAVPSQANSVLADISKLFQKYQESDQFRTRMDGIDRDAREFESDVRDLADRVAPEIADKPVEEKVSSLTARLQSARSEKEAQQSLTRQLDEQQNKLRVANEQVSEINAALDERCRQARCRSHDQLAEAARQSNRRRTLETTVANLEEQIVSQSGGATFEAFVSDARKEAGDADSLQPRIDDLEAEIDRLGKERDELLRQIEREEAELKKIDGSARAAQQAAECESIASLLEDQVQQLAVLRASSAILRAGIERHRQKNQGPVLHRASEIFRKITLGAFRELRADINDRGEPVLTGIRDTSGESVPVSGMSDGTCDQLYLALRLASLETWLDHHEPVPLIVDDVLLHFDDERAIETLQVIAQLSHRTQVIFFTHHSHIVEIAKKNLSEKDLFVAMLEEAAAKS